VLTAPSGETQAQRLATQIEDDVTAIPNAPLWAQRATIEYVMCGSDSWRECHVLFGANDDRRDGATGQVVREQLQTLNSMEFCTIILS
jgi:hypothetical protein